MALIKCPECGKEVSDRAKACIHCGYPLNEDFDDKAQFPKHQKTSYEQWVDDMKAYHPLTWQNIVAKGYPGK